MADQMYADRLVCVRCGSSFDVQEKIWACKDCGSLLDVKYNYEEVQKSFKKNLLSLEIEGNTTPTANKNI